MKRNLKNGLKFYRKYMTKELQLPFETKSECLKLVKYILDPFFVELSVKQLLS